MSIFTTTKPNLTVDTQAYIDAVDEQNTPPVYTLSPEEVRQGLIDRQSAGLAAKPDAEIKDMDLEIGPTGMVSVRMVRPRGARDQLPCIFYLHGGGWVAGGKETHDRLIRELAIGVGAAVIFPEYSLAPETRYPVALEQCYAVLEFIGRNCAQLGIDSDGLVIAGDSAGGTLATVLSMLSRERGGPKVIFQALLYPVTDSGQDTTSYRDFSDGPLLGKKAMKWYWDSYLPDMERRLEKNASPMQAKDEDLAMLPPTLIITAENDVLRDEAEEYAKRLDEAGVEVACVRFNGTTHDFMMLDGLANTSPARAAMTLTIAEMKKAFQTMFPENQDHAPNHLNGI
ncbi:MAG: alpha/beta hydrolase [Planctomycetes bacterium]|nr:alpha/beta hydrolase [Planctomycetota bacterium]